MNPVIKVTQVTQRFFRKVALDNVSLQVPPGVVYALLGENGAGKTTLLRSLLGFYRPQQGSLEILGLNPARQAMSVRRRVGYVADQPGLYPWMTVRQTGWFAAGFYPPGFLARYLSWVAEFQLPTDRRIRDLSKGMRAKVALACALAGEPELLILDEPTSGLDPLVRRSFLESMVDLAAEGRTVLLSSHQIQEVERVADWVAVIHQGRLQVAAPLEQLKTEYSVLSFAQRDILLLPPLQEGLEVVSAERTGRQWRCLVRGWRAEHAAAWSDDSNLMDLSVQRPDLDDLYRAWIQPRHDHSGWGNRPTVDRSIPADAGDSAENLVDRATEATST